MISAAVSMTKAAAVCRTRNKTIFHFRIFILGNGVTSIGAKAFRGCSNLQEAILRLLQQLSKNSNTDVRAALNKPKRSEALISVCDRLIASLSAAERNAYEVLGMLQDMKIRFS